MKTENRGIKLDQIVFYCTVKYFIIPGKPWHLVCLYSVLGGSQRLAGRLWARAPSGRCERVAQVKEGRRWGVDGSLRGKLVRVSVDLEPLRTSVLYSPVMRPERPYSAGANTTTRPSPSVSSTVIIVVTFLIGWKLFFVFFTNTTETDSPFRCRWRVSRLPVCRPVAEPGALHRLQRPRGLADLGQHLWGELFQVRRRLVRLRQQYGEAKC